MHHYRATVTGPQTPVESMLAELVRHGAQPVSSSDAACVVIASAKKVDCCTELSTRHRGARLSSGDDSGRLDAEHARERDALCEAQARVQLRAIDPKMPGRRHAWSRSCRVRFVDRGQQPGDVVSHLALLFAAEDTAQDAAHLRLVGLEGGGQLPLAGCGQRHT
jgi:hypothetical protein